MAEEQKSETPQWLTDGFLQEAVRRGEKDSGTQLLSSEVTLDDAVGDYYCSTMYRVKVNVSATGEKRHRFIYLLIKTLPKGEKSKKLMLECEAFSREIKMFSETLPAIRDLFEKKRCSEYEDIGARYYYHTPDNTTLVVENLAPKGFMMAQRQVGLDLDHSMLVMKLLAKYHASTIALRYEKSHFIESYPKHSMLYDRDTLSNVVGSAFRTLSNVALSWPNGQLYSTRILQKIETFMDDYTKLLEYNPKSYNVLIHGDLWTGNMLFKYNHKADEVEEVKFVDFQLSCLNSPAMDLQYFIHTSVTEEVREFHTKHMLKKYHDTLCDTLSILDRRENVVSFERFMEEYEKYSLQSVFAMLYIFPIIAADPEDAMDLEDSIKDAVGDDNLRKRFSTERVTKVLKKYIPIFIEKGLL